MINLIEKSLEYKFNQNNGKIKKQIHRTQQNYKHDFQFQKKIYFKLKEEFEDNYSKD